MKERGGKGGQPSVDERYTQWKSLVPVLYDWLANHNLVWPSLSCRWGPQLEQATYKNRQRLYLSEQTDGSVPNTLVIANCEVVKPRVAAAEHISQFNEEARSPFVKKFKTIIHPGEVNRIRELPQNSKIVATHTDSPDVLIWDVEAQPNRHAVLGAQDSRPDLGRRSQMRGKKKKKRKEDEEQRRRRTAQKRREKKKRGTGAYLGCRSSASGDRLQLAIVVLGFPIGSSISSTLQSVRVFVVCGLLPFQILTGHQDNAEFALAMCPTEPFVLSGGKDKLVVLWGIQDHISSLSSDPGSAKSPGSGGAGTKNAAKAGGGTDKPVDSPTIGPRGTYQGHGETVEDVQFCPSSAQEFCSVGDDSCLILWDARTGSSPVLKVEKAHDGDLHCVDWNSHDVNLILTGSADTSVRMFDRRNLTSGGGGSPVHIFNGHNSAVLCVQWSPDKSSVFGSSAEDGILNIWDHEKIGKKQDGLGSRVQNSPPGLFFRHAGHRDKVVDFHWNSCDPWTIVSVSDDGESTGGGGTLQIWRMIDLIYRPEEEVLAELDKFKSHILNCSS